MNTNHNPDLTPQPARPAASQRKSMGKRAGLASMLLVSTAAALFGLGVGSGTAQAEPIVPAPQHFHHYCDWDHQWYWDDDWHRHCHHHWW
jgi:hypothetical protein